MIVPPAGIAGRHTCTAERVAATVAPNAVVARGETAAVRVQTDDGREWSARSSDYGQRRVEAAPGT